MDGSLLIGHIQCRSFSHACEPSVCCIPLHLPLDTSIPHIEDGHMLSFIKPTRDGLVLVRGSSLEPVRLLENEIAILAGSLLTELSDYAIPAAYHAVLTPRTPMPRSSLIYFVNPDAEQQLTGFFRHQPIDLNAAVNARHTGFGNHPLQLT
jgi:hypothetical protein